MPMFFGKDGNILTEPRNGYGWIWDILLNLGETTHGAIIIYIYNYIILYIQFLYDDYDVIIVIIYDPHWITRSWRDKV